MSLVGWWKLDGNLEDSSGNGYTMSTSGSGMSYTTGKVTSQCEAFTGNGYLISSGVPDNIKKVAPVTMMAWIKTSGLSGSNTQNGIIALNYSRSLYLNTGNKLTAKTITASPSHSALTLGQNIGNSVNLADGIWHHVAMTDTTTNVRLYLDGIKVGEIDYTPVATTYTNGVVIGTELNDSIYKFTGSINDVRLYDEALSDEEIYNISKGLVVHYTFGNDNGNTVYDNSGYGNDGTISNSSNITWSSDSPKGLGSALFNGYGTISHVNALPSGATQEWTSCAWVKITERAYNTCLNNFNNGNKLFPEGRNTPLLYLNGGTNDYYTYGSSLISYIGSWIFIAFVFKNSTGRREIYCNGVNISTQGPNLTSTPKGISTTVAIGSNLKGYLTDYREYATSLSASDIKALYSSTMSATTTGGLKSCSEFNELNTISLPSEASYVTANGESTAYLKTKKIYPLQLARDSVEINNANPLFTSSNWSLYNDNGTGYLSGTAAHFFSNGGSDPKIYRAFDCSSSRKVYLRATFKNTNKTSSESFVISSNGGFSPISSSTVTAGNSITISGVVDTTGGGYTYGQLGYQTDPGTVNYQFDVSNAIVIYLDNLYTDLGDSFLDILSNTGYTTNAQIQSWCDTLPWIDPSTPLVLGKKQKITNEAIVSLSLGVNGGWSISNTDSEENSFTLTMGSTASSSNVTQSYSSSTSLLNAYYYGSVEAKSNVANSFYVHYPEWGSLSPVVDTSTYKYLTTNYSTESYIRYVNSSSNYTFYYAYTGSGYGWVSGAIGYFRHAKFINIRDSGLYSFICLNLGINNSDIKSFLDTHLPFFTGTTTLGSLLSISSLSCYNSSPSLLPMPRLTSSKRYVSSLCFNENALFDGLVAYYPLNGNSNDYSGNGNNGTINGASIGTGKNQQCYSFNGTSDYITASPPSNGQTLSFFCNLISNNDSDDVPLIYGTTSSGKNLMIYFRSSSSTIRIFGWGLDTYTGFTKDLNTWHLWTITSTGTEVYLYRDGIADNLNPYSASISITDNSLIIGRGNINTYSNCLIQDVRIYNRALTAQEIKIMYEVTFNRKPMITNIGVFAPKFSEV